MQPVTKIATCSYCGTRANLVFDKDRHELTCPACGAPLHEMKRIVADAAHPPAKGQKARKTLRQDTPDWGGRKDYKSKKKKRKKPLFWKALEEIIDILD